ISADLVLKASVTTTISALPTTLAGKTDNYGTVDWTGGDVSINDVLTNKFGALFTVQGDTKLLKTLAPLNAKVVNEGWFAKTVGAANAQTLIDMAFENSGTLVQHVGTLSISGALTQTGANSYTALF